MPARSATARAVTPDQPFAASSCNPACTVHLLVPGEPGRDGGGRRGAASLRRPLAVAIATVVLISAPPVDAPDGLAWLDPVLVLKLVAAHAVREEPYRPEAVLG